MLVVADENIPQISDALSGVADVRLMQGREITREDLKDADALLVRSITKVNESLLSDTPVKFVGSATIGMDHLDQEYLKSKNISYTNAAGCNANSVVEYVICAILEIAVRDGFSLKGKTLGIVGKGNIGRPLSERIKTLGMNAKCCDPPLQETGESGPWYSHQEILESCDFITYHVPITRDGDHPTYHMANEDSLQIKGIKPRYIINACRGSVIDNAALLKAISVGDNLNGAVLDVWENEPAISFELMHKTHIVTPHIAGYSQEGKLTGTEMITSSLFKQFGIEKNWKAKLPEPEKIILSLENNEAGFEKQMHAITHQAYKMMEDDARLRKSSNLDKDDAAKEFDKLRKTYPNRREFDAFKINPNGMDDNVRQALLLLNFGEFES